MTNASKPRRRPKGAEGPPTKLMLRVLKEAADKFSNGAVSFEHVTRDGAKAFARSLVARGLIERAGSIYVITATGRDAIAASGGGRGE